MKQNNINAAEYAQQMSISSNMANALVESFGYEPQLDELSMQDLGDFGRGALSGATFGFNKNIAAGANSLFKGTKYKDELQKQVQADREAEMRSPKAYNAGDIAGAVAMPIPGATALKGAMAAGKLGKTAMAASNLGKAATIGGKTAAIGGKAAYQGIGSMTGKAASDALSAHTLGDTDKIMQLQQEIGTTPDGKFGPKSKAKLKAWQAANNLPVTGVPDAATMDVLGLAESIARMEKRLQESFAEGLGDKIIGWGAKAAKDAFTKGSSGFGKAKPFIRNVPSNASVPATSSKAGEFIPKSNLPATAAQAAEKDAIDSTATGFNVAKSSKDGEFIPKSNLPAKAAQAGEKDAIDSTATGFNVAKTPPTTGEYIPSMKVGGKTANVDKNIADGSFREIEQKALGDNRLSSADKVSINKNGIKDWITKNPKKASMLGYLGLIAASNLGDNDTPPGMPGMAKSAPGMPGMAKSAPGMPGIAKSEPTAPVSPKVDDLGGPSDMDKVFPKTVKANPKSAQPHIRSKPHAPTPPTGDPQIKQWQRLLNANGANLKVDGKYSPEMQSAYEKIFPQYQRESKELERIVQLSRR
jgi:peptidoglycan hydrolase-like protein with peptidoglycan-binding domain